MVGKSLKKRYVNPMTLLLHQIHYPVELTNEIFLKRATNIGK